MEGAAEFRICDDVSSPVTFGWRRPVVLLPARFPELDRRMQDAILCHELLHVERRDWLFTLAEELVRAVFWFHPAIWWLLGEIQLAREQAVDREVIERTEVARRVRGCAARHRRPQHARPTWPRPRCSCASVISNREWFRF